MPDDFAQHITESQQRLYGYIYSLVGNSASSWDILQETNLVLWRKKKDFQPGTKFDSWAFTVARFQVLAFLRDRKREPLTVLSPELMEVFSNEGEEVASQFDERLVALKSCHKKLATKGRRLLALYYEQGCSIKEASEMLGVSPAAAKQALFRTRKALLSCIELSLPPGKS